ncbi:MAG: 50S ribosomal protein L11 methyltransferase, partial [Desulfobulbaceae bacterium]|nr:50S ribosomal protein L11 methyltransferase [Desulfobulbaceae bacterium]
AGHDVAAFGVDDLTVAPLWDPTPADIRLDPSVIFGSGFHPTTRMCLAVLLKYLAAPELTISTMLDLGCGTGLLGIAAAKRGVGQVTAVDYNSLACELTAANAERNGVGEKIKVQQRDLLQGLPDTAVDLVVANLYRDLLQQLFTDEEFWKGKLYIISGFISGMEPDLLAALPMHRLRMLERHRSENWCLWVLLKTS